MTRRVDEFVVQPLANTPLPRQSIVDFDASLQPALEFLLGLGRAAGADLIEFFLEKRNTLSLLVEDDAVTAVEPALVSGAGIRAFFGGRDAFVSTNDLSLRGIHRGLERALAILGLETPSSQVLLPGCNLGILFNAAENKDGWLSQVPSSASLAEIFRRANALTRKKLTETQTSRSRSNRAWQEVLIASSDGVFSRDIRLNQFYTITALAVDGADRAEMAFTGGSTSDPGFIHAIDFEAVSSELAESAGQMLRADFVESGQYPVVMGNGFGGVIFHEACGHLLETTQVQTRSSPFWDKKGQKIAHESVTAWDEGRSPQAYGSLEVDDEGMPTQRTLLIENGILRNFLADRQGSRKTDNPRTGSGRRQDHRYAAASRMRNTYFASGKYTKQDLLDSMDRGIYCKKMGGGSVGPTGDFNFAVTEAYLVENGRITKPLKGATLIGSATDILPRISMFANDLEVAPGHCGSVSGTIPTTVGQPHIKVDHITVGGR